MTERLKIWGAGPSPRYDDLAAPYRAILPEIAASAITRERTHALPFAELAALKRLGIAAIRLPQAEGGGGATLPELFALLIEISAADPNLTNALRSHFGMIEDLLLTGDQAWRGLWLPRVLAGDTFGSALSEVGGQKIGRFDTGITRDGDAWRVDGEKFYTTGSLFAEWLNLGVTDAEGNQHRLTVPRDAPGVEIIDDWDGFGQQLSASGTIRLSGVRVEAWQFVPKTVRFGYSNGFFQMVHLATLAGIGRAAADETAALVAARRRVYGRGNAASAAQDPQILEAVGRVRAGAYAAGAIVLQAATALERAHQAALRGAGEEELRQINRENEFEVNQAVVVVTDLILAATTTLFDALSASATLRSHGLDRHWRNARTLSSHNPRIYHARIVGDWAVNRTEPRHHGGVGIPPADAGKETAAGSA